MYYAKQSPRGFANEIDVYTFKTRSARDRFVALHADDGDVNAAYCGAESCLSREAHCLIAYRGDAVTQSYNSSMLDGDAALAADREISQISL